MSEQQSVLDTSLVPDLAGAATEVEELVVSVSELLAVGASDPQLRPKILASGAVKTWIQVASPALQPLLYQS